jgi:uncharacterized protein (UPF0305 family)
MIFLTYKYLFLTHGTITYYHMADCTESVTETAGAPDEHPRAADAIREVVNRFSKSQTRKELGVRLAYEVQQYSLFDLQIIGGRLNCEIEKLPSPYREAIRPFFREQLFGRHHELLAMHRTGKFSDMDIPLRDAESFRKFCDMIPAGCFAWDDAHERNPYFRNPKYRLFYYLISAFTMFVIDEPGHPEGMPFPGGFTVEKRGRDYYCLIRDKEKEVFYSICNFCPAIQSEDSEKVRGHGM